jgi:hypothetical protein
MSRVIGGVLAILLVVAGAHAIAPAASAASSVFAGTWVSIDTDGSQQTLAIGQGPTPVVTYQDFYASSCAADGSPSSHFVATGRGTIDGSSLAVDFRNGGCGRVRIGPFGLSFQHDGDSGTLTDDFGVTWYRFP